MPYEIEKFFPPKGLVEDRKNYASFKDFWDNCPYGDWMITLCALAGVPTKQSDKDCSQYYAIIIKAAEDLDNPDNLRTITKARVAIADYVREHYTEQIFKIISSLN